MRQLIDQIRKKIDPRGDLPGRRPKARAKSCSSPASRASWSRKGVSAGNWVRDVAPIVGGGGGGKPDLAQAGGKQPEKLPEALTKAREVAKAMLGA